MRARRHGTSSSSAFGWEDESGMFLSAMFVYPVKACRGIALDRETIERRGLRHDRRWMIVDETGRFVTQRTEPRLARVETALGDDGLVLTAPGLPALRLPLPGDMQGAVPARRRVTVWRDAVDALDCGEAASAWISGWLQRPSFIVCMPDDVERPVNPAHAQPGDLVSFADGYPLLLTSTSSLDDLNARLEQPLPMDRFRPNLVVSGGPAWSEDGWARLAIGEGEVAIRVVKPCGRCTVTTVDQKTAEGGVEPLRTLATFRKTGQDVLFGQNCVPDALGPVSVGDAVRVLG
jgi:uncharacterized protein YcbX